MYNIIRTSARSTRKTLKLSVLSVICVQTTSIVKEHKCKDTTFFAEIQIIYQLFVSHPVFLLNHLAESDEGEMSHNARTAVEQQFVALTGCGATWVEGVELRGSSASMYVGRGLRATWVKEDNIRKPSAESGNRMPRV